MYEISSEVRFSAAHRLKNYNGPCENLHGHNWTVKAVVRCEKLDDVGIGFDFKQLRALLGEIVARLDHRDLNTVFDPAGMNPSSENLARYIFDELVKRIDRSRYRVGRVEVFETPGNSAAYFEDA